MRTIPIILASMLPLFALEMDLTPERSGPTATIPRSHYHQFEGLEQYKQYELVKIGIHQGPFLVVKKTRDTKAFSWTLNGKFYRNSRGEYANFDHHILQVVPFDCENPRLEDLFTLSTEGLTSYPRATTYVTFHTQLAATTALGDTFSQGVRICDSLGVRHTVTSTWTKIDTPSVVGGQSLPANATQHWKLTVATPDGTVTAGPDGLDYSGTSGSQTGFIASFNVFGDPVQWGYPGGSSVFSNVPNLGITWTNGSTPSNIALNLGIIGTNNGIVSLGGAHQIIACPIVDGREPGSFKKAHFDGRVVSIEYTNQQVEPYARIPHLFFDDPDTFFSQDGFFGVQARLTVE